MKHAPLAALCALILSSTLTACAPTPTTPIDTHTTCAQELAALRDELAALRQENAALATDAAALSARMDRLAEELTAGGATSTDTCPPAETLPTPDETPPVPGDISLSVSPPYVFRVENGQAILVAYCADTGGKVVLPTELGGYPVTAIGDGAFRGATVTAVAVAPGVTHIGRDAFADCPALSAVTLPASVISIAEGAFDTCPALTLYCPRGSSAASLAEARGWRYLEV